MATTYNHERNLGYFEGFMRAFGRASRDTRAELYRDTQAYSYGAEPASLLYQQVTTLLGVTTPPGVLSPQPMIGKAA